MHPDQELATEQDGAAPRPTRRLLLIACLALIILGGLLVSAAVFNDATRNEAMRLDVGTVDIAATPVTFALDATGLVPGDVVATTLDVINSGSLELRYAATSTVDDAVLADELELTIRTNVTSCDPVGAALDGTLVSGPTPVRLGSPTGDLVIGNPQVGADPGDRVLGSGDSEQLCLRVELPASATEAVAGRSVSATIRLEAEQTAANP